MSLQLMHYLLHGNPHYTPPPEEKTKRRPTGEKRACLVCGDTFELTSKGQGKVYCSVSCKNRAKIMKSKLPVTPIKCSICATEFVPRRHGHATCSAVCSEKLKRQRREEWKQNCVKDWGYEVKCSECGNLFMKKHALHATCCKHCSNRRERRLQREKKANASG